MRLARNVGVITPLIFDIDLIECRILMEFTEGPTAKTVLEDSDDTVAYYAEWALGQLE